MKFIVTSKITFAKNLNCFILKANLKVKKKLNRSINKLWKSPHDKNATHRISTLLKRY